MFKITHIIPVLSCILICVTASQWSYNKIFDNNFKLNWNSDKVTKVLTFVLEGKTKGWVGFGLSHNGRMAKSDLVIGWVNDQGQTFFHDRWTDNNSMPVIDRDQNWHLLNGYENKTHTILHFERMFDTLDNKEDLDLCDWRMNVLYAYSSSDPKDPDHIPKHDVKGVGHFRLVDPIYNPEPKEDLKVYDLKVENITIPKSGNIMMCKLLKFDTKTKVHGVKFMPMIKPVHLTEYIHHMSLFECLNPNPTKLDPFLNKEPFDCHHSAHMSPDIQACFVNVRYPVSLNHEHKYSLTDPDAGILFGKDPENMYFVLEVHVQNLFEKPVGIFTAYLRVFYTEMLRKNDLGIIAAGGSINTFIIPPKQPRFLTQMLSNTQCYKNIVPNGIYIESMFFHTHALGKELYLRHFRNGIELAPICHAQYYDPGFQVFEKLRHPEHILPNDEFVLECYYDSSSKDKVTTANHGADDEMCNVFLSYYPKFSGNAFSQSQMTHDTLLKLTGLKDVQGFGTSHSPKIILPKEYSNLSLAEFIKDKKDWMSPGDMQANQRNQDQVQICSYKMSETAIKSIIKYPEHD